MNKDYIELSNSKRLIAFLSVGIVYFFYCYNFSITAIYKPLLIDSYGFLAAQLDTAFALMSFGTLLGTIIAGFLAAKLNKKIALVIMSLGFIVPTFLHILTFDSFYAWAILRFIAGTALGGIFGTSVALICDMFAPKYRGRLTSLLSALFALAFSFGFTIQSIFAATTTYAVLLVGSLVPFIGVIMIIFFVPNTDNLLNINEQASKQGIAKKPSYLEFIKSAPLIIILAVVLSGMNFTGYSGFTNNSSLFIASQVEDTLDAALASEDVLVKSASGYQYVGSGENIVVNKKEQTIKTGDIIDEQAAKQVLGNEARSQASKATAYVGIGHFIGFLTFGFIGDYFGRKKNRYGMLLSVIAGAAILLVPYNGSLMPYILLGLVLGFSFGYSGVWGAYYSELVAPRYRGMAAGFCFNMGRIFSTFTVPAIGVAVDKIGVEKALFIPLIAFIIGVIVWSLLPETLNKNQVKEV